MSEKINQLERVLQTAMDEYYVRHVHNFHWILKDIEETCWCDNCDKTIMRGIYSNRNGDEICCSLECLQERQTKYIDWEGNRRWWNGEDWQYNIIRSKIDKKE
jgi:formylmethanofuran dehydrogenase subunit E